MTSGRTVMTPGQTVPGRRQLTVRAACGRLMPAAVAVYLLLAGAGLLLTRVYGDGPLIRNDRAVSQWFLEHRTPSLDQWSHVGSTLSDTVTAIGLTVVLVLGLRLWLGRWRESVAVLVSILGELFLFVLVTATVHRQRPSIPHLDPAPPTSSFPSGHTGAAVALYVGTAVIVVSLTRASVSASTGRRVATGIVAVLLCLVPVAVGLSRMYRGMHFLTDVIAGAVAGGLWMAVVMSVVLGSRQVGRRTDDPVLVAPPHDGSLSEGVAR